MKEEAAKCKLELIRGLPALSPRLNPIENLFSIVQRELDILHDQSPSKSDDESLKRFRQICKKAEKDGHIQRIIESMPSRVEAIIKAKGGPIDY